MSAMSSSQFSRFLYLRETVAREGGKFPFLLELFDFGFRRGRLSERSGFTRQFLPVRILINGSRILTLWRGATRREQ